MTALLVVGALSALIGVGMGAFGAHPLAKKMGDPGDRRLHGYRTGVQYHLLHAVAIVVTAVMARSWSGQDLIVVSGWLFFAGIVLFSGSLYGIAFGKIGGRLGLLTPIGGLAFMAGWASVALSAMPKL